MSTRTPVLERPVAGTAAETTELKRGALKLLDSVVIAVSSTAPAYSVATALGVLAVAVALGAPAAIWVGFIPVMGVAVGYYYLNRLDPNCGASYSWVSKALHPTLGFLSGWVAILASLLFMSFAAPQAGQATLQLLNAAQITGIGPLNLDLNSVASAGAATVIGILWLALVTYMVMVGIRMAARFQYVLLALEYFIVVGFAILGFFKGGGSGFSWSWLDPRTFGSLSARSPAGSSFPSSSTGAGIPPPTSMRRLPTAARIPDVRGCWVWLRCWPSSCSPRSRSRWS